MPLVLFAAKCHHVYCACKVIIAPSGIAMKRDAHGMGTFLVLVDQHQGPLAIRAQHGVRGDQDMSGRIADVTCARENTVLTAPWLDPFEVDHLTSEELGCRLQDLVLPGHRE